MSCPYVLEYNDGFGLLSYLLILGKGTGACINRGKEGEGLGRGAEKIKFVDIFVINTCFKGLDSL